MEPSTLIAGAGAVLSLLVAFLQWSLARNLKSYDEKIAHATAAAAKANERAAELEKHEAINKVKEDIDNKFDQIKTALAGLGSDVAVLKDRDQSARANDRQAPRRRRS